MYEDGTGVPQDYSEAVKWYRMAADQGNDWAQYSLGSMYEEGRGVPEDHSEALKWYQKAADKGNFFAKLCLEDSSSNDDEPTDDSDVSNIVRNQKKVDSNPGSNKFTGIFQNLPYEQFVRNPDIIISYMMDFGFSRVQVNLFKTVLSYDHKRFTELLSCEDVNVDLIVRSIAEYCLINEAILNRLIVDMRIAMKWRG